MAGDDKLVAATLTFKPAGEGAAPGEIAADAAGWPLAEARYDSGGRWLFCSAAVVARWGDGPAVRFLLARLLERLSEPDPKKAPADKPEKENAP